MCQEVQQASNLKKIKRCVGIELPNSEDMFEQIKENNEKEEILKN